MPQAPQAKTQTEPIPAFVYVTYIAATPERVWQALTDGEVTKDYWGRRRNVSDWKPGSPWRHEDYDDATVQLVGTVLESNPPHRLVMTWAGAAHADNPAKRSRVTFEIAPFEGLTRLQVTHDEFQDPKLLRDISGGWPVVLSGLKSLLETGTPIPSMSRSWRREPIKPPATPQN